MGPFLIAALLSWDTIVVSIEVAVALGAVIFVHELGHFAVAKLCGVKCEKFYLGFDLYGLKLAKFKWGETEYGIGILPLGGYVKMLGQEDNPAALAEEIERAKAGQPPTDASPGESATAAERLYDPRSFLAKSVPQRMAIISAGVIMNIIFAFLIAVWAFRMGVEYTPCVVSELLPGEAAWRSGLQPGDEIVRVGKKIEPKFTDLQQRVMLGNLDQGIDLEVRRPGVEQALSIRVFPDRHNDGKRPYPMIGILGPRSNRLSNDQAFVPGSPAARTEPALLAGDEIVGAAGHPVQTFAELEAALAAAPEAPVSLNVRRTISSGEPREPNAETKTEQIKVELQASPLKTLGISATMGPITAIQSGSPAEVAGLQVGQTIVSIDGEPVGDPQTLSERLRRMAGKEVTFAIQPAGSRTETKQVALRLREAPWFESPLVEGHSFTVPAAGIAFQASAIVASTDEASAAAGIAVGDRIIAAQLIPPPQESDATGPKMKQVDLPLDEENENWPFLCSLVQSAPEGTRVVLKREGKTEVELLPHASGEWFNPDRGLIFAELNGKRVAETWNEAIVLGRQQLVDSVLQVYLVIKNIVRQQISSKVLGGPVRIAAAAGMSAYRGLPELLIFLSLLSANLAVVNFLPIPLLDGGHMVFLAWEGIRGKPASERVIIAFHYAGLCLILSLMIWVLFQDAKWLGGIIGG